MNQNTLKKAATLTGIGLHSGNKVTMTFLPAPPNSGIRFRRVDLDGRPEIEAIVDNVGETRRSTTLTKGNVKINTVEHVLAALSGSGVHNAIIELDATEPPITDGSARAYCEMIKSAGVQAQDERCEEFVVANPIEFAEGVTEMAVFPYDGFRISCTSADEEGRFTQYLSLEISAETWEQELAHARTFCFYDEIEWMIRSGMIKGGSLENAVVIRDDAVLTTEPLRYTDEFVRHKILDILGDLSLIGRPLRGHVIAIKPSHKANCELAKMISFEMQKPIMAANTFLPPPSAQKNESEDQAESVAAAVRAGEALDIEKLLRVLPHRYPFLMVDRVLEIEGNRVVAIKNVTINEPYFQGHFPGHPIMPGVLQLEAMAQVAGILMLRQAQNLGKVAYFMSAENVKWRKPVRPGDTLRIEVELTKSRSKIGRAKGACYVGDDNVSEAEVTFMLSQP
ncbi:MAG: bifunctional UDP-3-O-[3-hydroxymyristoyl] N-acetylglucosamine deacetylase/3-hydroxyacyl-ACP dehydratase [Verrucomicrobia bacterium]|nr:bifunctional UDP-3-O-[3-hydroxymyristoyl] N-acetylglucosamine deacetylase/3-hydroxyacyl-ACP dehydratase [Verrucomicrobiota bacterium]